MLSSSSFLKETQEIVCGTTSLSGIKFVNNKSKEPSGRPLKIDFCSSLCFSPVYLGD